MRTVQRCCVPDLTPHALFPWRPLLGGQIRGGSRTRASPPLPPLRRRPPQTSWTATRTTCASSSASTPAPTLPISSTCVDMTSRSRCRSTSSTRPSHLRQSVLKTDAADAATHARKTALGSRNGGGLFPLFLFLSSCTAEPRAGQVKVLGLAGDSLPGMLQVKKKRKKKKKKKDCTSPAGQEGDKGFQPPRPHALSRGAARVCTCTCTSGGAHGPHGVT